MITAVFTSGFDHTEVSGLWQWDYGQKLRIQGLNLPPAVEIHFSLSKSGGESEIRVGVTKDGVTDVPIPDSMLENGGTVQNYYIYAFIYITDETSGKTVKWVQLHVNSRPKPEAFDSPEKKELFREAIAAVNESAGRAETSEKSSEAWAHGHEDYPERGEDNAKFYSDKAGKKAEETASNLQEVSNLANQVKENAEAVASDKNAVEEFKNKAGESAENAAVSESNAALHENNAKEAQTKAETAQRIAEEAKEQVAKDKEEVLIAKNAVKESEKNVAENKEFVRQTVENFTSLAENAVDNVNVAGQNQVNNIEKAGQAALDNIGNGVDEGLTQSGKAADAKKTGERIDELKSDLGNYLSKFVSFGIKEKVYIDDGTEKADNGWSATDYICIDDVGNDFVITYGDTTNFNPNYYSTIYDENKNPVKNINMHIDGDVVNFGTNGKYVRFSNVTNVIKSMKIQSINSKAINFVIDNKESIAEIPNIKNDIEEVKNTLNNSVPSYYVEHIKEKETIIRGHESDCGFNGDSFVFLTDTHHSVDYAIENDKTSNNHNSNNSVSLIRDILKNTATRMVIFGGDLIHTSNGIDEMLNGISSYVSRINEFNFHYCVGNHEYFTDYPTQATIPTYKQLYTSSSKKYENDILGIGEGFSYYFDNPVQKVRYFVISCDSVTWLSIQQTEWILKQFENIPSGYKFVCIGHAFISDDMTSFRNRYKIIADALDAIKNKTTYDFVATEYTTYHHDYSSIDITPICMITGHTHVDGSITTPSGITCICTTCDSYSQNYEYVDGTLTNVPREIGTVNEQAFDVIQFDFDNRKIYCTRIGAGSDREFSY